MNGKKSKISLFTCIALCSVSLLAQTNALRAADEVEEKKVVVTSVVEEVVVDPLKLELAAALEVEDVVSIKKLLKTIELGDNSEELETHLNSLIRSVVGSPIPADQYFDSLGLDIIRSVQKIESLRVFGRTIEPHASDYYTLLPENLSKTHVNLKYYEWLSQVVYTVHACLQNKVADVERLQGGYSAYFCGGVKGYEWLQTAPKYFEKILGLLAKNVTQENPYFIVTTLFEQKRAELLADLEDRVKVYCAAHPTKGELKFVLLNAKKGPDSLLAAFGLSYEESVQIILDAIPDGRLFTKDKAGYYDNINRRLYTVNGGEAFVKEQISLLLNHYASFKSQDSLSWAATLLNEMDHVRNAAIEDTRLKSDYQQKCIEHKARAPYLSAEISTEPSDEAEHLSWSVRVEEWKRAHPSDFDRWEAEKAELDRNYKSEHFNLIYRSVLARINQSPEALAQFIQVDFARLFKDTFVEINPQDTFQSMAYVALLFNLKSCNLGYWKLISDPSDPEAGAKIISSWGYTVSPLAYDINVLDTADEDGHVHYLKLVSTSDTAGLMKAIRSERALGLSKITALNLYMSPENSSLVNESVADVGLKHTTEEA